MLIICSAFEDNAASNENAKARANGLDRTSGAHFPALPLFMSVLRTARGFVTVIIYL